MIFVTDQITTDLANDGSMMFKVTNKEESMLFLRGCGSEDERLRS